MNTQDTVVHDAMTEAGTGYVLEHIRNGVVIDRMPFHNLVPTEGLTHMASVVFKSGTQVPTWYIGLFSGDFTPVPSSTAANFPGAATEFQGYAPSTRVEFNEGAVTAGVIDNTANKAEFSITTAATIYGAFMASAQAKGSVSGVLVSAARFPVPKVVAVDDVLRVTASVEFKSA